MAEKYGMKIRDAERDFEETTYEAEPENEVFIVDYDGWPIWVCYLRCTFRHLVGFGFARLEASRESDIEAVLRIYQVKRKRRAEYFEYIQMMQRAVIEATNDSRSTATT